MENQNYNDPSKDQVVKDNNPDHPVLDNQDNEYLDEPIVDEHLYKEETATELTNTNDQPLTTTQEDSQQDDHEEVNNIYGWIAIALSAISFFLIPILFAGAGIILGFIARNREAPILGNTAIVFGVISILFRLFILPLI
ncbi:MAG TPA: hypothetical protein VK085_07715 [Pseudogracilibacillus sp.]|nr:hypothetical protein [Pseudogracilibacillus sp.]